MKSKFKNVFLYSLVAAAVAGFGGQAGAVSTQDSTSQRGVYRANTGRLEVPAAAGSLCGSLVNGATYAACQGYDLVGAPAGWNATLYAPEVPASCIEVGSSESSQTVCTPPTPAYYYSAFINYGQSAVDGYGNALTVNGPGWVAGRAACPPAYVLTQTSSVNILGDFKYTHSCVKT